MQIDGYSEEVSPEMIEKYQYIQELNVKQQNIDAEMHNLSKEIAAMPTLPYNLGYWIESFHNDFKMSDFKKMFEIKKRYEKLMEEREANKHKIKMFVIDGLIGQIKEIEEKKQVDNGKV